jgi:hypothetical protein
MVRSCLLPASCNRIQLDPALNTSSTALCPRAQSAQRRSWSSREVGQDTGSRFKTQEFPQEKPHVILACFLRKNRQEAGCPHQMVHPIHHYLSEHFPELEHPKYQSSLEIMGFLLVTSTLVGLFIAALALLFYTL